MKRKKFILTLACMAMVVSISACENTSKKGNTDSKEDAKNENVQISNPWVDCKNMEEA